MNINFFKIFCDLVETESFSQAAEKNGVSQPAVSQQLASLERHFGIQLINRGGRKISTTQVGAVVYKRAKEILQLLELMRDEARTAAEVIGGVLYVGTIYSVGLYLLHNCIRDFSLAHPEVDLRVEYTHWERIYAAVASGEMDLGVVAYPQKQKNIDIIPLTSEELVIACPPGHKLVGSGALDPARLNGERFVAFAGHIPTRKHVDRLLKDANVKVNITMEFDNIDTIKRAVEVGAGISILPFGNIVREISDDRLKRMAFTEPDKWVRPLGVIRKHGRTSGAAEQAFLKQLQDRPGG